MSSESVAPSEEEPSSAVGRDFERMLDLDRSTAIKNFIDEMEARMREVETAQAGNKDIVDAAKRDSFTPAEIIAMMDGLQVQWVLNPDQVDMAAVFACFVAGLRRTIAA